jgi:uncharacterized protein YndB with AHSA1/START domain
MKRTLLFVFVLTVFAGLSRLALFSSLTWAQAPPQGQQGAPGQGQAPQGAADAGRGGRGGRGALPPRIHDFQAKPTLIKPGESFVLSWSTESGAGTIDNGIGAIPPRGTIRVTPKATTTYTLSMGGGAATRSVTVTVEGTTPVAPAPATDQAASSKPIPRIDGKPDFSGIYGFGGGGGRGARGGGDAPQVPASPYANLPAQPALKTGVQNRANQNPSGGTADCMPLPADRAFGVPYPFQIAQNKDHLIFLHEYPGTFRIIPLDGEPHQVDPDPTWMGESVGRWEGETLVIDTVAFNGKQAIGGIQQPSEKFHTIERLTRSSATNFFYEIVYEDSEYATGPWRATRTFNADTRPSVYKVMEFICENNRDYTPLFGPQGPPPAQEGGRGGRGQRGADPQ